MNFPLMSLLGNRCGHIPKLPRFYCRPAEHKPRPSVLEQAIAKLQEAYLRPKKFLSRLNALHPKSRCKRSERREAIISVSQVLLHYLELSTFQVGFYSSPKEFLSLDLNYIAKKAGLSFERAKRAIQDLVKSGYLTVTRRFDRKEEGGFKGLPSLREFALRFFIDLGVDGYRLFSGREWKRKKHEKAIAKNANKTLNANKTFQGIAQAMVSYAKPKIKRLHYPSKKKINTQAVESQALIRQALDLHRQNPNRSPGDYLKELQRQQK